MRIANVADVHLGNHRLMGGEVVASINRRGQAVLDTLARAYGLAKQAGCEAMIINGDLFDTSKPPPQMVAAAQRVIADGGMPTWLLMGNHDMESSEEGDHALGPLVPVATVLTKPAKLRLKGKVDAVELWAVPFRPGKAEEWLPTVMAEVQGFPAPGSPASSSRVLALHLGLRDSNTAPWLLDAHDSVPVTMVRELMDQYGLKAVYAGNWHEPKVWGPIVQIGTLCPTGWDNPGLGFGTMAIFDTAPKASEVVRVPGPRFVTSELEALKALEQGCQPFVRLKADEEELPEAEATVAKLQGLGVEAEVLPDATLATVALRTAAGVARSADSVEDAVAQYVQQMPLEEPELRPAVLERVKKFLVGGDT